MFLYDCLDRCSSFFVQELFALLRLRDILSELTSGLCGRMSAGRIAVEMHLLGKLSTQSFRFVANNAFIKAQILTCIKCPF